MLGFTAAVHLLCFVARRFRFPFVCGLLQEDGGVVLELPDSKARGFLVFIVLKWLFTEHARKVFGEMLMRT
jgi:hypothetical protein